MAWIFGMIPGEGALKYETVSSHDQIDLKRPKQGFLF